MCIVICISIRKNECHQHADTDAKYQSQKEARSRKFRAEYATGICQCENIANWCKELEGDGGANVRALAMNTCNKEGRQQAQQYMRCEIGGDVADAACQEC